jgi:hypothetical protein
LPGWPHYLMDWTRTPPTCSCRDHCRRGGQRDPCKHVKARFLQLRWGTNARKAAGEELARYLRVRGVAGTSQEILLVVHTRLKVARETGCSGFDHGYNRLLSGVQGCSFLRPVVRPLASLLLRPGPERREVKLRQRWRRQQDNMRPARMKGAAHRGGGAAKRRDKSRDVGHNGGALARAQRKEKAKARGKKRRVRVVAAARQTSAGQVSLSLSSVQQAVSRVRVVPVIAPALSAFMARAQAGANKLFTF